MEKSVVMALRPKRVPIYGCSRLSLLLIVSPAATLSAFILTSLLVAVWAQASYPYSRKYCANTIAHSDARKAALPCCASVIQSLPGSSSCGSRGYSNKKTTAWVWCLIELSDAFMDSRRSAMMTSIPDASVVVCLFSMYSASVSISLLRTGVSKITSSDSRQIPTSEASLK